MKIMSIFSKKSHKDSQAEELYKLLNTEKFEIRPFQTEDLGEKMAVVNEAIGEYWKPRFLLDHRAKKAYEFMSQDCRLLTVTRDDIDWKSLKGLEKDAIEVAKELSFYYPSFILKYENGVAKVRWQLNPNGMYYMDEDGYGMTDDEEVNIYGVIDRTGKVVEKFKYDNEEDFDDEEDD